MSIIHHFDNKVTIIWSFGMLFHHFYDKKADQEIKSRKVDIKSFLTKVKASKSVKWFKS